MFRKRRSIPNDAVSSQGKFFAPAESYAVAPLIHEHLSNINYKLPPTSPSPTTEKVDRAYSIEDNIWNDVIERKTRFEHYVQLNNFHLFEWLPRSPGLYFTREAEYARQDAEHHVYSRKGDVTVYNPYGKYSLLQGGYGTIRLKPISLSDGDYFLVSASSSGICHKGFPVAVPKALYLNYLDSIIEKGSITCSLIGKIQFIEGSLEKLYFGYRSVPHLYLKVQQIFIGKQGFNTPSLYVTPAIVFVGEHDDRWQHYVSFVTANLTKKGSLDDGIKWMEEEYVSKKHKGEVIIDFDQQQLNFPNAIFSLDKVMAGKVTQDDMLQAELLQTRLRDSSEYLHNQKTVFAAIKQEVYMDESSKYKVTGGNVGAFGENAQAHDFTQVSNQTSEPLNLDELAKELNALRKAARKEDPEGDQDVAIGKIAAAEEAAKQGDQKGVLQNLAGAGKWVLDIASKIGVALAVEAIKKSMQP